MIGLLIFLSRALHSLICSFVRTSIHVLFFSCCCGSTDDILAGAVIGSSCAWIAFNEVHLADRRIDAARARGGSGSGSGSGRCEFDGGAAGAAQWRW